MNRGSILVGIARLFQKLPLSVLRIIESPLVHILANKKSNIIIILALPRSGSTLLYQSLVHTLEPFYLNNLGSLLFKIPLLGGFISYKICNKYSSNFESNHGFVEGGCGPAEGLAYWDYWLGMGLEEKFDTVKSNRRKSYLKKTISILGESHSPIVTGYLGHILFVSHLNSIFPNAIYIRLVRDPLQNALSILAIRKKSKKKWFSIFPKECVNVIGSNLYAEVATQVYWLNKKIENDINRNNSIYINYDDLCKNPNEEIMKIIKYSNKKGLNISQIKKLPNKFIKKNNYINDIDRLKLIEEFKILENRHGKLTIETL